MTLIEVTSEAKFLPEFPLKIFRKAGIALCAEPASFLSGALPTNNEAGCMNLLVVEKHDGEGIFPLFPKGTAVNDVNVCDESSHWLSCVIYGHETYIPDIYAVDGVLTQDYNPTELVVEKEQIVTLISVVFEWVYVKDGNGREGWLPASKVISL